MKMLPLQAAIAAALLSVAVGISAKPLVVCTEASPEGFDPVLYTTAVTADAPGNHKFYTDTLGLRLVKKTVNQDDVRAYHLFYGDGHATPGSDLTFFDWPATPREQRGRR